MWSESTKCSVALEPIDFSKVWGRLGASPMEKSAGSTSEILLCLSELRLPMSVAPWNPSEKPPWNSQEGKKSLFLENGASPSSPEKSSSQNCKQEKLMLSVYMPEPKPTRENWKNSKYSNESYTLFIYKFILYIYIYIYIFYF